MDPNDGEENVRTIDQAEEGTVDIHGRYKLWYRTWGNRGTGLPVLFVHGGPGNCVADYRDVNRRFFRADRFFVVEVDQRGTGRSTPSVRDSHENMQHYLDIDIGVMSSDFEAVRMALGIERWLVFGGSWGSALGLDYGTRHPSRCLGLILRGIYLNTPREFDAIYARRSFEGNRQRLAEFDAFFKPAAREAERSGEAELDPNDSERFIRLYERLILRGERDAIWRFHVFEHNLMEEDPSELLDPKRIDDAVFPEAQSIAFFECRLFLRGTFEVPVDLLGNVQSLAGSAEDGEPPVRTWICQGTGDEVCPEEFAQSLETALKGAAVPCIARYVDAGHVAGSDGMTKALRECVNEFEAICKSKDSPL